MRRHRFLTAANLATGRQRLTDAELCHQAARVLRLRAGEEVELLDGRGHQARAKLVAVTPTAIDVEVLAIEDCLGEPTTAVTLACAVLKRENFELVVQKATEVGVRLVVPLLTARTVKTGIKHDRLLRIAAEAVEQSGRGTLPIIREPTALAAFLDGLEGPAVCFHTGEDTVAQWRRSLADAPAITVLIGPEGGWTDEEVALMRERGVTIGSLGGLTLRGETAAIVAAYEACQRPL